MRPQCIYTGEASTGSGGPPTYTDFQTLSLPAKWTDEKHNSYLNSMESSFVNQLCNNENASSDLLGCLPLGTPKPMKLGSTSNFCHFSCQVLNPDFFFLIDRFYFLNIHPSTILLVDHVLQFESLGTMPHNFARKRTKYELKSETRQLFENPWVRHFTSRDSLNQVNSNGLINRAMPLRKTTTTDSSHMPSQHHAGNIAEGSDQNFDDIDSEGQSEEEVAEKKKSHTVESPGKDKKP